MCDITIDEAIKHCKEVAVESVECESCCSQHSQLANWLEELKAFRGMSKKDKVQDLSDSLNYLDCAKCELKAGCMALESAFNVSLCDSVNKVAEYYKKNHEDDNINYRRVEAIQRKRRLVPDRELYNRSGYYIVDDIVVRARGVAPEELTPRDIIHFTKPECRMVIQRNRHLECHFPEHERESMEVLLEKISKLTGFTYTIYTCDTRVVPETTKPYEHLTSKGIPSIVLAYDSSYYILNGKVEKTFRGMYDNATPEEIMSIRNPGELTVVQDNKHLKIYIAKTAVNRYVRVLDKAKVLGFTYEFITE